MERKVDPYPIALYLLIAMHLAGLIGLKHPASRPLFELLIPFNLITTTAIVFFFHKDFNKAFFIFCITAFLTGYLIEVAGVHTGVIFGEYAYGKALGFKMFEVPLLIGVNWLALIYCTGIISSKVTGPVFVKAATGAFMMVFLDYFIEPVAIQHDFWSWTGSSIPFRNYVAWFIMSFLLLLVFHYSDFKKNNRVAPVLYFCQLFFFIFLVLLGKI